jgi:hypothetical protein
VSCSHFVQRFIAERVTHAVPAGSEFLSALENLCISRAIVGHGGAVPSGLASGPDPSRQEFTSRRHGVRYPMPPEIRDALLVRVRSPARSASGSGS